MPKVGLTPPLIWLADAAAASDAEFETTLAAAVPEGVIRRVSALEKAMEESWRDGEILVLVDPDDGTLHQARMACDADGLPRWPVVVCRNLADGAEDDSPEIVARGDWKMPQVRRVLRGALDHHRLRRENARFRGDLATFGFRVSHDLRTPLGGVLTTTEMLKEILAEDFPAHVPLTQPIIDSAEGLVKLIERTSFFAKVAASTEAPSRWNMGAAFWNAFQHLEGQLLQSGASLAYPTDWPMVDGHAAWFEAVWHHLITNALQHGGPLVRIQAGWSPVETGNCFWLHDSGSVAPERRAMLFYPFNRLHEPRAPRGLGLPIMRRIVELEGGYCGFESPPEGGSRFTFTLPAAG